MKPFKEISIKHENLELIVRVIKNDDYKGEAFVQLRIYEQNKIYAYVPEKNLTEFLRDICGSRS